MMTTMMIQEYFFCKKFRENGGKCFRKPEIFIIKFCQKPSLMNWRNSEKYKKDISSCFYDLLTKPIYVWWCEYDIMYSMLLVIVVVGWQGGICRFFPPLLSSPWCIPIRFFSVWKHFFFFLRIRKKKSNRVCV